MDMSLGVYLFLKKTLKNFIGFNMSNNWSYIFYTWRDFAPPGSGARGKYVPPFALP